MTCNIFKSACPSVKVYLWKVSQFQSNIVCMSGWQSAWERRDRGENVATSPGWTAAADVVWRLHQFGRNTGERWRLVSSDIRVTVAMCPCVLGAQKCFWSHLSHRHHHNLPAVADIFIQFSSVIVPAVTSNTLPHQTEAPLRVFTCYFDGASPSQATICFILTGPSGTGGGTSV